MLGFILGVLGIIFIFFIGIILGFLAIIWAAKCSDEDSGFYVIKGLVELMPNYAKLELLEYLQKELD